VSSLVLIADIIHTVQKQRTVSESADQVKKRNNRNIFKKILKAVFTVIAVIAVVSVAVAARVTSAGGEMITDFDEACNGEYDCILVLGCSVWADGSPSPMLSDRVETAVALYKQTGAKLLMSGDHGSDDYNEVGAMKAKAMELGADEDDIYLDHAGFSTYDSIVRAKKIFGAEKIAIVTQFYHLPRALYIAKQIGITATGIPADRQQYASAIHRILRELLAQNKDFIMCLIDASPAVLGEAVDMSKSGRLTEERNYIRE